MGPNHLGRMGELLLRGCVCHIGDIARCDGDRLRHGDSPQRPGRDGTISMRGCAATWARSWAGWVGVAARPGLNATSPVHGRGLRVSVIARAGFALTLCFPSAYRCLLDLASRARNGRFRVVTQFPWVIRRIAMLGLLPEIGCCAVVEQERHRRKLRSKTRSLWKPDTVARKQIIVNNIPHGMILR